MFSSSEVSSCIDSAPVPAHFWVVPSKLHRGSVWRVCTNKHKTAAAAHHAPAHRVLMYFMNDTVNHSWLGKYISPDLRCVQSLSKSLFSGTLSFAHSVQHQLARLDKARSHVYATRHVSTLCNGCSTEHQICMLGCFPLPPPQHLLYLLLQVTVASTVTQSWSSRKAESIFRKRHILCTTVCLFCFCYCFWQS